MKRLVAAIIICFIFPSLVMAGVYDTKYMAEYSQNLSTAISRINATGNHYNLIFHNTVTLTADCNAPDNIAFEMSENGLIILGNYNLYIQGDFRCEPGNRAFNVSGSGRVYFRGSMDRVYPEWFGAVGDGSTDDTNAFDYAHQAGQGIIELSSKTYDISALKIRQPMRGISHQKSIIDVTGAGLYLSPTDSEKFIEVSDIKISGTNADYASILIDCNQSRGYLKNLYLYTDGNNGLTGIRLRKSHHSSLKNILMYGGTTKKGFQIGIYIDSDSDNNVNNCSFSDIYIADANYAIRCEQYQYNNVFTSTYLESCGTGVYFAGDIGANFVGLWWDSVTTWINAAYAGGNYSKITTEKEIKDVQDNSAGLLDNFDIRGRGVHLVKKLANRSGKAFTVSCDPNVMVGGGNLPPEIRLFGWNRNSDDHYGYTQGGICFSVRPTYGKIVGYTYTGSTESQFWEVDPTSTTGYRNEKVIGANGEYFQNAIRSGTLDLSGATSDWNEAILAGRRILGVNVYVTDTITGSGVTGFKVGDGTDADRWGDITGTAIGTVSGPSDYTDESVMIYDALTTVRITATGGSFTDGTVRIVIYFQELGAPTS